MNADDIDHDQAQRLQVALLLGLNFLRRLITRMQSKGFARFRSFAACFRERIGLPGTKEIA
jgi:hypothetical protein